MKGVDNLLEAVAELDAREGRTYHLTLVGDGTKRGDYERFVAERGIAGNVTFAGYQDDVRPFLIAADVFVLAVGGGTTGGDTGGTSVRDAGREHRRGRRLGSGSRRRVVRPNDPTALADGIESLAGTDLAERGRIAREYMIDGFDIESMMAGYTAILDGDH
nr:glycosyltransferase [Haladaptatus sp. R4]